MDNKILYIIQTLGLIGFVLALFNFEWGWFIGFLCTGIFFLFRKLNKRKILHYGFGAIAFVYSFYYMFSYII